MTSIKDQYLLIKKSSLQPRYGDIYYRIVKTLTDWEAGYKRGLSVNCLHLDGTTQRWRKSDVLRYATKRELIEAQKKVAI